jgi:septal ring factor EnvC (AmiA/AmiB activator)
VEQKDFDIECAAISQGLEQIVREIEQARDAIRTADDRKAEAKTEYAAALDGGDEKGMKMALGKIRQGNQDRESLVEKLRTGFQSRIGELAGRQQALRDLVAESRQAAEAAAATAQAAKERADRIAGRRHGLQIAVNAANNSLTAALDSLGPNLQDGRIGTRGTIVAG